MSFVWGRVILSLCDRTGEWSKPYSEAGYDVRRIDIEDGNDIRLLEHPGEVHGILAAPPCTVFAGSGARWWADRPESDLTDALALVDACLRYVAVCEPEWWVLENPVGRLSRWLGPPRMWFDPCDYGDPYTKHTGLWGNFNHRLPPDPVEPTEGSKMHLMSSGDKRRSITPAGFARAFFEANP